MPTPFFFGDPSLNAQQLALENQQGIASGLTQQAFKPVTDGLPQGNGTGSITPRLGAGNYLAKLAAMLGGAELQKTITDKRADLFNKQQDFLVAANSPKALNGDEEAGRLMAQGVPEDQARLVGARADGLKVPSPQNPQNIDPKVAARMQMQNPDLWYSTMIAPTDETRNVQQSGADPRLRGLAYNARFQAEMHQKLPEGFTIGPDGHISQLALPPPNANATVTGGPNGSPMQVASVAPVPGALPQVENNAQAGARGTTKGSNVTIPLGGGNSQLLGPQPMPEEPTQPGPGGQLPAPQFAPGRPTAAPPADTMAGRQVLGTGPTITSQATMKSGVDRYNQDLAASDGAKQALTGLGNALGILEGPNAPTTGHGSEKAYTWKSYAQTAGIPIDPDDTTGYQSVHKYLLNALNAQGQAGSDARLDALMGGNPNTETMSPTALKSAIRYVQSQLDAKIDRAQFVGSKAQQLAQRGDTDPYQHAYESWTKQYDPKYYDVRRAPIHTLQQANSAKPGEYVHTPQGVFKVGPDGKPVPVTGPQ